jgi:hypothetical protein
MYATVSYWEAKMLVANAVRWAAGEDPPAKLDAPLSVELTAWDQGEKNRRVFHLVNVQSDIGRTIAIDPTGGAPDRKMTGENLHVIQEILPVRDLGLRFKVPTGKHIAQVTLQPNGAVLDVDVSGEWASARVPEVWVHEAVVVEWRD